MSQPSEAFPMILDIDACETCCVNAVRTVEARPDGELMLRTHFRFPDQLPSPAGGLRLSDHGHTLMHISYEHDIDSFLLGTRMALLERIVGESSLHYENGTFSANTSVERLPEAIFGFGQALTRIFDLTLLSRSNVGSTFYDDLADSLTSLVDESKIERDYKPDVPNAEAYPADYRIEGKSGTASRTATRPG